MEPTGEPSPYGATAPALRSDRAKVIALWQSCGLVVPHNPPGADFDLALGKPNWDILTIRECERVVGSVMVGHDGHRGWVYYLAFHPERQRQGLGAVLVAAAEDRLRQRGIRKIQLMVRDSNQGVLDFYLRVGYEPSPVVVMQRWLEGNNSQGS